MSPSASRSAAKTQRGSLFPKSAWTSRAVNATSWHRSVGRGVGAGTGLNVAYVGGEVTQSLPYQATPVSSQKAATTSMAPSSSRSAAAASKGMPRSNPLAARPPPQPQHREPAMKYALS